MAMQSWSLANISEEVRQGSLKVACPLETQFKVAIYFRDIHLLHVNNWPHQLYQNRVLSSTVNFPERNTVCPIPIQHGSLSQCTINMLLLTYDIDGEDVGTVSGDEALERGLVLVQTHIFKEVRPISRPVRP